MSKKSIIVLKSIIISVIVILTFSNLSISKVNASHQEYSIRFTAKFVTGDEGVRNVYYVVDGGSAHLLGTVKKNDPGDFNFDVTFSESIRVYVHLHDGSEYHEHLYVDGELVDSGDIGEGGLTYSVNGEDSEPPVGRIIYPISGGEITACPVIVRANVEDGENGVAWVVYWAYYDGVWHQIATDNAISGEKGWSTWWDCSKVTDQEIRLKISAEDNIGNRGSDLGGIVVVHKNTGSKQAIDQNILAGQITDPASGATISKCPVTLKAEVNDASRGVAWVKFWANYDSAWHEIGPVVGNSDGWMTTWDCNPVSDQKVNLKISGQNNSGFTSDPLGETISIDMKRLQPSPTGTNIVSPTTVPTQVTNTAVSPTIQPQITQTQTIPVPTQPVRDRNAWGPFPCSITLMPMIIGLGFLTWRKRTKRGFDI